MRHALALSAILAFSPTANAEPFSTSPHVNSCSNVTTNFSYYFKDHIGEGQGLFSARGTFRISDERDESRQPAYNLAQVRCERKAADYNTQAEIECTVTEASVGSSSGAPSPNAPNCILDVDVSVFTMKEIGKGVLAGMADNGGSTSCYNATLTINRNTKRVLRSFERTQFADNYDRIHAGTCGPQRTQALMNCTAWVGIAANNIATQGERLCDFEEH